MITVDPDRLRLRPGDRVLDIGCGSGRHMDAALRRDGVHVTGIDLNDADLSQARDRCQYLADFVACRGRWTLVRASATALPFPDAAFDAVICAEVLEHVPDHRRAAAEAVRVLRPGGDLAVSVPRRWPETICWGLSAAYRNTPGGHIRIYRREALMALLQAAGTVPRDHHYAHGLHTPYWWLKCLAGPDRPPRGLLALYHRLLVWDMMAAPRITRLLERLLNPLMGKSRVVYLRK
ncbi:MAG: class I SAM-dependent methyltransferase [Desulfococcaceae bacterium]